MLQMYLHSTPVPNRSHKKSYKGCRACKLRKVKCGEEKPVCKRCSLHYSNVEKCDYDTPKRNHKKDQARITVKDNLDPSSSTEPLNIQADNASREDNIKSKSSPESNSSAESIAEIVGPRKATPVTLWPPGSSPCKCPCHASSEYADMLSDALFGICRICGNFPSWTTQISQCCPVVSPKTLLESSVDPFGVLPLKSSPSVSSLMYHWVNTLALVPTKIHSHYCTNPTWLTAAISSPALFNVTLYVSSLHVASLKSERESTDSLFYKAQTVQHLNECLRDSQKALCDETIAAVLCLLFIVCVIGEESEVEAHIRGLKQMIKLRGGIQNFAIDGVFLHMLCTTNHLTAVLDESPSLHPPTGLPVTQRYSQAPEISTNTSKSTASELHRDEAWKHFGVKIGFHPVVGDVMHELGYAYSIVDAFTRRLLPHFRPEFNEVLKRLEDGCEHGVSSEIIVA